VTTTPELIDELARNLDVAPRRLVERRLALGGGIGLVLALAAMVVWLGLRPDLAEAMGTAWFWIKFAYTLLLGCCLLGAVAQLSRPGGVATRPLLAAFFVVAAVAAMAVAQLAFEGAGAARALVLGSSAAKCPWVIVVLSVPILAGLTWALRGLAPTRPTVAGAAVGLMSGAMAAWIYSFHCDEVAIPFLALWYTLGIAGAGVLGGLVGRSTLRW
jgi:hypothetical protein